MGTGIPTNISETIISTLEVNPLMLECNIIDVTGSQTTGGTTTFVNPGKDYDYYISSIVLSLIKDATCDVTDSNMSVLLTSNGVATAVVTIPMLTLTAQETNRVVAFPKPFKVDNNTTPAFTNPAFSVGKLRSTINVQGIAIKKV